MVDAVSAAGLDVLDLLPAYERDDPALLRQSRFDRHPSDRGHMVIAGAIAGYLRGAGYFEAWGTMARARGNDASGGIGGSRGERGDGGGAGSNENGEEPEAPRRE